MLKYYFFLALRNLFANRFYTAISIGGLAVAFATIALITIYINDELSYDKWNLPLAKHSNKLVTR